MAEVKIELEEFPFDSPKRVEFPLRFSSPASGRTKSQPRRSTKGCWSEEEDNLLTEAVKKHNGRHWKKIAACISGRTDVQCLHRWQKVLNPELVKGSWTKKEDDCIIDLVTKSGCKRWSFIAKFLPGRIGKQCRERWHNHLDPAIKKDAWTEKEESILFYYYQKYGSKWAEIARFLPGRTDNAIKNHWNCSMKKRLDAFSPYVHDINVASPNFYTSQIKPAATTLVKAEGQSLNRMVSSNNSLVDWVSQSASRENFCIESSSSEGRTLGISTKGKRRSIYSRNGMQLIDGVLTFHEDNACTNKPIASAFDASWDRLTTELDCVPLAAATKVTRDLFKSPKRLKTSSSDAMFAAGGKSLSPLLSQTRLSNQKGKRKDGNKNKINRMLQWADENSYNLASPRESIEFPSTENNTNGYYHTPPKSTFRNLKGDSSPESVLRSLAMTYENIPSIIRKRTYRKIHSPKNVGIDTPHTPFQMIFGSPQNEGVKPKKQGSFISFIHKPKTSEISKSLQGCLDCL